MAFIRFLIDGDFGDDAKQSISGEIAAAGDAIVAIIFIPAMFASFFGAEAIFYYAYSLALTTYFIAFASLIFPPVRRNRKKTLKQNQKRINSIAKMSVAGFMANAKARKRAKK